VQATGVLQFARRTIPANNSPARGRKRRKCGGMGRIAVSIAKETSRVPLDSTRSSRHNQASRQPTRCSISTKLSPRQFAKDSNGQIRLYYLCNFGALYALVANGDHTSLVLLVQSVCSPSLPLLPLPPTSPSCSLVEEDCARSLDRVDCSPGHGIHLIYHQHSTCCQSIEIHVSRQPTGIMSSLAAFPS